MCRRYVAVVCAATVYVSMGVAGVVVSGVGGCVANIVIGIGGVGDVPSVAWFSMP